MKIRRPPQTVTVHLNNSNMTISCVNDFEQNSKPSNTAALEESFLSSAAEISQDQAAGALSAVHHPTSMKALVWTFHQHWPECTKIAHRHSLGIFHCTRGTARTFRIDDHQKTFRYLWRFYSLLFRGFFVLFSWLFRGPLLSRKTVFGPFSLLFCGFFVAFSWPPFWANFTRTRPGTVFWDHSGGRGCLGEGHLGLPGQVWELRFLPSFPSFPRENCTSKNVGKNAWKSQTSFFQTSAAFW